MSSSNLGARYCKTSTRSRRWEWRLGLGLLSVCNVLQVHQVLLLYWLDSGVPGKYYQLFYSFHYKQEFYLCWVLPSYYLYVFGDGVGFWGVSCITAVSYPAGHISPSSEAFSFSFVSSEILAAFGMILWSTARGEVLHVYIELTRADR